MIPEALLSKQSDQALEAQACTAKKKLGYDCDCESVKRGAPVDHAWHSWPDKRVVPLTLELGLGC